jgi:hypothetical protein
MLRLPFIAVVLCAIICVGCSRSKEQVAAELAETRTSLPDHSAVFQRPVKERKKELSKVVASLAPDETMQVKWASGAIEFIKIFEGGTRKNPEEYWKNIATDFDCMGISAGLIQFNVGSGSMYRLAQGLRDDELRTMLVETAPNAQEEIFALIRAPKPMAMAVARTLQEPELTRPCVPQRKPVRFKQGPFLPEFKNFLAHPIALAVQKREIDSDAARAERLARDWAKVTAGRDEPDIRERLVFLDLVINNGGLSGITARDVEDHLRNIVGPAFDSGDKLLVLQEIENWLNLQKDSRFKANALQNIALWKRDVDKILLSDIKLLALARMRSDLSKPAYRALTFNRKALLTLGYGRIYDGSLDMRPLLEQLALNTGTK